MTDDPSAFCRREWPRLVGLLSAHCRDVHVAEELAQEALLRACERWDEVRTTAAVTGGLAIALLLLAIEVGLPFPPLPVLAALLPVAARAAVVAVARQRSRSPAS